jgi:hypothetical protein
MCLYMYVYVLSYMYIYMYTYVLSEPVIKMNTLRWHIPFALLNTNECYSQHNFIFWKNNNVMLC